MLLVFYRRNSYMLFQKIRDDHSMMVMMGYSRGIGATSSPMARAK
jgi:hypothetical protein